MVIMSAKNQLNINFSKVSSFFLSSVTPSRTLSQIHQVNWRHIWVESTQRDTFAICHNCSVLDSIDHINCAPIYIKANFIILYVMKNRHKVANNSKIHLIPLLYPSTSLFGTPASPQPQHFINSHNQSIQYSRNSILWNEWGGLYPLTRLQVSYVPFTKLSIRRTVSHYQLFHLQNGDPKGSPILIKKKFSLANIKFKIGKLTYITIWSYHDVVEHMNEKK